MQKISHILAFSLLIGLTGCAHQDKGTVRSDAGNTEALPTPANQPSSQTTSTSASTPAPASSASAPARAATETAPTATVDYTVQSGDSLWKIAHNHHTTVHKLKTLNNLSDDKLKPGMVLKVPQS